MDYEIRAISNDEFPAFALAGEMGFGAASVSDDDLAEFIKTMEFDRTMAVFDGTEIVGTGVAFSFQMTMPGLTTVPTAGVSWITVLPTHRRRGILRRMMQHQLADVRRRGEPLAILLASESVIYGRFGYGLSTTQARYEIEPRHGTFGRAPESTGRVSIIDKERAKEILPLVYDRARRLQPGALTRSPEWWDLFLGDPERWRDGQSARFYVIYESRPGQVDGYSTYRVKQKWDDGFPQSQLTLGQLETTTTEARAGLWRYLLNVDLVTSIRTFPFPIDEPLRWMLADPRRLRVTGYGDFLWTRLVDIPTALSGRRYPTEDRLSFEVVDEFLPDNSGRCLLEGGPDGATCRRGRARPDLTLQVTDLGAAYLGGVHFTTLARAGRVVENTAGALQRADLMFAAEPAAFCATDF